MEVIGTKNIFKGMSKKLLCVSILCIAVLIGGVGAAGYTIWSNNFSGTSTTKATLSLTGNATTVTAGDTLQLTAHLSDSVDGITVYFYDNSVGHGTYGTVVGNTVTAGGGNAVVDVVVNDAGPFSYNATCTHP